MENKEEIMLNAWGDADIIDKSVHIIKVIGVGGGGSNAVRNMYKQGICNVSFAICNTDSQHLKKSDVPVKVQLGNKGLGAGGDPEEAKKAAEESLDSVNRLFEEDTQMVFVAAGMGGGTGTGAAPIIAGLAKEKGILTVGVVTIPFAFEGKRQIRKALKGVEEMRKNVDALLVVNNECLCEINGGQMDVMEGFAKSDEILITATKNIAEIITVEGMVNRDFRDVETVMKNGGDAIMSVGYASGEYRVEKAFLNALNSPLLNNVDIEKAQRLLYIVYSCKQNPVMMYELREIRNFMDDLFEDVKVLWGLYSDDTLKDQVKVILIATDFIKEENFQEKQPVENSESKQSRLVESLMRKYYGNMNKEERKKERTIVVPITETAVTEGIGIGKSDVEELISEPIDREDTDGENFKIEKEEEPINHSSRLVEKLKQLMKIYMED